MSGLWLRRLKAARIASQILFFCGCLYVYLRSLDPFSVVHNPFLRWDPLIFLTNPQADLLILAPMVGLIALALALGRVFCGWICPMGSLMELSDFLLSFLRRRNPLALQAPRPRSFLVRNPASLALLGATLVTVFTTPSLFPYLHPNVWIVRVFSLSALGLVFLGLVLASSVFGKRLWCVYVCPLGALYGILSRVPLWRLSIGRCSRCEGCALCPMQAADPQRRTVLSHQCTLCFAFEHTCPVEGFRMAGPLLATAARKPAAVFDPARRQLLIAGAGLLGGALVGGALGRLAGPSTGRQGLAEETTLLRPPGVVDEATFLRRCVRCGHCVQSCPNQIIRTAGFEAGLTSLLTPRLAYDTMGCDYRCQVCQLVCPNQAIPRQTLARKQHTPIGLAAIDQQKCVVFAERKPCLVCEEVCPTTEKAVVFLKEEKITRASGPAVLRFPSVVADRCIGCGICQANCPADKVAITVARSARGVV